MLGHTGRRREGAQRRERGRSPKRPGKRERTTGFEPATLLLLAAGVPKTIAARAVSVSESVERWLGDGLRDRVDEARAAGQEQADATSEARLVVLITLAARTDWRAASGCGRRAGRSDGGLRGWRRERSLGVVVRDNRWRNPVRRCGLAL